MGILSGLGKALDPSNSKSPIGVLGKVGQKISDPLALVGGKGYLNFINDTIPEATNKALSTVITPFRAVDKTVNPVRRVGVLDKAFDWTEAKPADTIAAAAGAYFGGGALLGAMGGSGGTTASPAGATSAQAPANGTLNWQQLARMANRQNQGPRQPTDQEIAEEMERRRLQSRPSFMARAMSGQY